MCAQIGYCNERFGRRGAAVGDRLVGSDQAPVIGAFAHWWLAEVSPRPYAPPETVRERMFYPMSPLTCFARNRRRIIR